MIYCFFCAFMSMFYLKDILIFDTLFTLYIQLIEYGKNTQSKRTKFYIGIESKIY